MRFVASLTALVVLLFGWSALHAEENLKALGFPPQGTPYEEARNSLLKQGAKIAPNKVEHPDRKFREINCHHERSWNGKTWVELPQVDCIALFLETYERGWRRYVVVSVDPATKAVTDVHYPSTVEALPNIPPPLGPDVPQLQGSYLKARKLLRELGFNPAHNDQFEPGRYYLDREYVHFIVMPETDCSGSGMAFCRAYWISKDKRVLRVTTIGENRHIYYVEWSTWADLKKDFGNKG